MPIFEYLCKKCNHQFEELILSANDPAPKCPKCQNENVEKLMSAACFRPHGIPTGAGGFKAPSCAPSGG
ncbi:FmdB family zinc ribbon protein [Desulfonema magnum]|uniref:Zinc ribbon domain-containing protein n=1 Tax=Desulfonema magnum TaxID=45655 RepID=A0A975BIM6_9BACT|nr:zinc ribbon domain-containing protein [Desulfonema magnum]QTA86389.1 Zinc ribbon domain-containing protein [Desulfonema magnum]